MEAKEAKAKQPKTKEELATLKAEFDALNEKLKELNDDELTQVTGGIFPGLAALP